MNVFIIGTPLETAAILDSRRLRKQIIECKQILAALRGQTKFWRNHPCTIQYENYEAWLELYMDCLKSWLEGDMMSAVVYSDHAENYFKPLFHTEPYFDSMKRRLYTKDPEHYAQWAEWGTSDVNWYWSPVEDTYIYYRNSKKITMEAV